jgi:energy-coupling factor transporter transmembrane protein EcfT
MGFWIIRMNSYPRNAMTRGLATLLGVLGTVIAQDLSVLTVGWTVGVLPLVAYTGVWREHLRFLGTIVVPIAVVLAAVWWGVIGAPPGARPGSAPLAGLAFALATATRIALLGGLLQLCLVTLKPFEIPSFLHAWGLRGEPLVIATAAVVLLPELRLRVNQILVARYARGLVGAPTPWARLRQIPFVLRPLLAWSLRSAIQRADMWKNRDLLGDIEYRSENGSSSVTFSGLLLVAVSIVWLVGNVYVRFRGLSPPWNG